MITVEIGERAFSFMKNLFTDFYKSGVNYFEELVEANLQRMIVEYISPEGRNLLLSYKVADKVVQRYYDVKQFKDPENPENHKSLRWRLDMLHLIFKCGLVLLASNDSQFIQEHDIEFFEDTHSLVAAYPWLLEELNEQDDAKELSYLHKFVNYLRVAMPIIPAASNKHLLLKILERLEGSNTHYVTGGGMKPTTRRRMRLIEIEGHAPAVKRHNRRKHKRDSDDEDGSGDDEHNYKHPSSSSGDGLDMPGAPLRESTYRIDVDFDHNIVPSNTVGDSGTMGLWNLIDSVGSEAPPILSGSTSMSAPASLSLPQGSDAWELSAPEPPNHHHHESTVSMVGIPTRPKLLRNHSLFTPDLPT